MSSSSPPSSFSRLKTLLGLWAILETIVFVVIVHWIGLGNALLAGLITTLVGAALLKRVGAAAVLRLRAGASFRGGATQDGVIDGGLRAVAAIALLLPGFLGDLLGIALAIAPVRAAVVRRLGGTKGAVAKPGTRRGPGAIDLSPDEWTSAPPAPRDVAPKS